MNVFQKEGTIHSVEFRVSNPHEVKQYSVGEVYQTKRLVQSKPQPGSLFDTRMGPIGPFHCSTCKASHGTCTHHTGHISLVYPLYHPLFYTIVVKILRSVCMECSALLLVDADVEQYPLQERLDVAASKGSLKRTCGGCGAVQPIYHTDASKMNIQVSWRPPKKGEPIMEPVEWTSFQSYRVCLHISAKTVSCLGLSCRPDHLFVTTLTVSNAWRKDNVDSRGMDRKVIPSFQTIIGHNQQIYTQALKLLRSRASVSSSLVPSSVFPSCISSILHDPQTQNTLSCGWNAWNPRFVVKEVKQAASVLTPLERNSLDTLLMDESPSHVQLIPWMDIRCLSTDLASRLDRLQFELTAMFFTFTPKSITTLPASLKSLVPHRTNLTNSLKGKDQFIRRMLQGKKTHQSGRALITLCSDMDIDEVGIPVEMATVLSKSIRVHSHNLPLLQALVQATQYPQALAIHKEDGVSLDLTTFSGSRHALVLEVGWMVERCLLPGDIVVVNRQPSLHLLNMRAFKVRVHGGRSVMLSQAVMSGFAGDFDGDEVSIHNPSVECEQEVWSLMSVSKHLTSAQSGQLLCGLVQDAVYGLYKLTQPSMWVDRETFYSLAGSLHFVPPCTLAKEEPACLMWNRSKQEYVSVYTGGQIVSLGCPALDYADCVRQGTFIKGPWKASDLSSLLSLCLQMYGKEITHHVLSDWQRLGYEVLTMWGVSVCLEDCQCPEELEVFKHNVVKRIDAHPLLSNHHEDGGGGGEAVEAKICQLLQILREDVGQRKYHLLKTKTRIDHIVESGSKGKPMHPVQIICPGLATKHSKRIDSRLCILSPVGSQDACSKGMILSSFEQGLHLKEMFFQAVDAREGICQSTSSIGLDGYTMRKIRMATENTQVNDQCMITDPSKRIVQFVYGGDSLHPAHVVTQHLPFLEWDVATLQSKMTWCFNQDVQEEVQRLVSFREALLCQGLTKSVCSPFPLSSLVQHYSVKVLQGSHPMRYAEYTSLFKQFMDQMISFGSPFFSSSSSSSLSLSLDASLCFWLSSKFILDNARMDQYTFQCLLDQLLSLYRRSLVSKGCAVGFLATSSLCEPYTQGSLSSFHLTNTHNVSALSRMRPSLQKIVGVSNTKTTSMYISWTSELSREEATFRLQCLQGIRLSELVAHVHIEPSFACLFLSRHALQRCRLEYAHVVERCQSFSKRYEWIFDKQAYVTPRHLLPETIRLWVRQKVVSPETTHWVYLLLYQLRLRGFPKIQQVEMHGTTLFEVRGGSWEHVLSFPGVCAKTSMTDNVCEIARVLGIEAANQCLTIQIKHAMEAQQATVLERHGQLLARCMTQTGHVMPLHRFGFKQHGTMSVLQKVSFEQPVDVFVQAALYGQAEPFQGVTECLMAGLPIPVGTGLYRVSSSFPPPPPPSPSRVPLYLPLALSTPLLSPLLDSKSKKKCVNEDPFSEWIETQKKELLREMQDLETQIEFISHEEERQKTLTQHHLEYIKKEHTERFRVNTKTKQMYALYTLFGDQIQRVLTLLDETDTEQGREQKRRKLHHFQGI